MTNVKHYSPIEQTTHFAILNIILFLKIERGY